MADEAGRVPVRWDGMSFFEGGVKCVAKTIPGTFGDAQHFRPSTGARVTAAEKQEAYRAFEVERDVVLDRAQGEGWR